MSKFGCPVPDLHPPPAVGLLGLRATSQARPVRPSRRRRRRRRSLRPARSCRLRCHLAPRPALGLRLSLRAHFPLRPAEGSTRPLRTAPGGLPQRPLGNVVPAAAMRGSPGFAVLCTLLLAELPRESTFDFKHLFPFSLFRFSFSSLSVMSELGPTTLWHLVKGPIPSYFSRTVTKI